MQLTHEQEAIIETGFEHCVITAVAGSGKTTTLAHRIKHLLNEGHDPQRLLILMFNRSAREDFAKKLSRVINTPSIGLPEIRTYHSMGYRLYKRFINEGYLAPIQSDVLQEHEIHYQVWRLITQLAPQSLQDEIKRSKKEHVETASNFIDLVKSTLSSTEIVFEELGITDKYRYLIELYDRFEQWRKQERRITYADMLYEPVMAIHQNPALQMLVSNKMDIILVDEYQDTNEIQHLLLKYIAGTRARVTVVGDPDQTIYEFRGARPEFILNRFAEEFESPKELTLSYTFRYGHKIALLANHLISFNKGRKDVICHSHPSTPATEITQHSSTDDARFIADYAKQLASEGGNLNDVAVLFRVWSQSVQIELQLLEQQVPYKIDRARGALFTREVQTISAILELAAGRFAAMPAVDRQQRFEQILRFPHIGLKEFQLRQICQALAEQPTGWGTILEQMKLPDLKKIQSIKIDRTAKLFRRLEGKSGSASSIVRFYVQESDLYEGIRSLAMTHESAEERIGTVKGVIRYLHSLNLPPEETLIHLDELRARAGKQNNEAGLLLSTMHRTKGLEWPIVIIPGMMDKFLPYTLRTSNDMQSLMESERRLLYVAMTRTINHLHLLVPPTMEQGGSATSELMPSRFVKEMRFDLCDELGEKLLPADSQSELTLNHAPTKIARRYAELKQVTLKQLDKPTTKQNDEPPTWHHDAIHHAIFGDGNVIGEDDRSFKVKFEDGKVMDFSKKSAHLYFSKR
ncbi:ATP-dependent helicase [Alkalimarinus sediminis]|uniref:DNA 3'-5' helicase n=1 Tax=Alkalimarinus sediminis TaxID=1632866 RepID=A0A9E8HRK4_9ALTE|nr:ATP-dependent helicase [Alkalimarinus sediminis]UZW74489.1 ATP-dependent helicase [Alkalimarinus sediminis]